MRHFLSTIRSVIPVLLVAVSLLAGTAVALDKQRRGHDGNHRYPLDSAVNQVRRNENGRVLNAETVRKGGRDIHSIRVLTPEGRVRQYRVDPDTGKVQR